MKADAPHPSRGTPPPSPQAAGEATLCAPDGEKSCFACCPPIRPAGYEHLPYKNIIRRELRENTRAFDGGDATLRPITGFSCWALGYVDAGYRLVGCLLHPLRNGGRDLRYRVDYGGKCARESCPESVSFLRLGGADRRFWLGLTEGMDSFAYSSRSANPLFRLLGWGHRLLGVIASSERGRGGSRQTFFGTYPFFETVLPPRANAYLLTPWITRETLFLLRSHWFRRDLEAFAKGLSDLLRREVRPGGDGPPIHGMALDKGFKDMLRLSLRRARLPVGEALRLKAVADEEIGTFYRERGG